MDLFLVTFASFLAGCVDAIVGGGGLIMVPALFAAFPLAQPATLFGTNKSVSIWGTAMAAAQYSQRVQLPWRVLVPAIAFSFVGAIGGAWWLTLVSPDRLRLILPVVLVVVFIYTLAKKDLGRHHAPRLGAHERWAASLVGLGVGFYDGFFGPGTGSFFVFLLVRWLGYDFLNASACAKLLNVASNGAALLLLALKGHVWWHLALGLAVANVLGSLLGTRLALKHGAGFVRGVFLVVVSGLILKTSWDAWQRWQVL
jgi:uncharacterized membrane protein YfcA